MNNKIDGAITELLAEARKVIRAGQSWSPALLLMCGSEKLLFAFPSLGENGTEKEKSAKFIDGLIAQHQAEVAALITDVWTAGASKEQLATPVRDRPDRGQALAVTVWDPSEPTRMGLQPYHKQPDGTIQFDSFEWAPGPVYSRFGSSAKSLHRDGELTATKRDIPASPLPLEPPSAPPGTERLVHWDDLRCDHCPEPATHVCIEEPWQGDDELIEHAALCDQCFWVRCVGTCWVHKPEDLRDLSSDSDAGRPGSREGGA